MFGLGRRGNGLGVGGELLGGAVFAAFEFVFSVGADVDGLFAVGTIGVAEEPPADKGGHDGYAGNEHAEGGTGSTYAQFGRRMCARRRTVRMVFSRSSCSIRTCRPQLWRTRDRSRK